MVYFALFFVHAFLIVTMKFCIIAKKKYTFLFNLNITIQYNFLK